MNRHLIHSARIARRTVVSMALASALLLTVSVAGAFAAGPQALPEQACNVGTATASRMAPNRTASEAIPHIEHAAFLPIVPYCHHFNPTASPPAGL